MITWEKASKLWLYLSLLALTVAGFLAVVLVIARIPALTFVMSDAVVAKKCLVVHVNLALNIWLFGFLSSLLCLLRGSSGSGSSAVIGLLLGGVGTILLMACLFLDGTEPLLTNYIPVLQHPLFFTSLGFVALGVTVVVFRCVVFSRFKSDWITAPAEIGLRLAGLTFLCGMIILGITFVLLPKIDEPTIYYEMLFWGAGHVFQFANLTAMLGVWLIVFKRLYGYDAIGVGTSKVLFSLIFLPALSGIYLAVEGITGGFYYHGFTRLMQFGSWPAATCFMIILLIRMVKGERSKDSPVLFPGMLASMGLITTGFILGAMIRGSNTLVPAHYHACIGAVSVGFMTIAFVLLERFGFCFRDLPKPGFMRYQPAIFGIGQFVFALGFALAGWYGSPRKAYADEHVINSTLESVGIWTMAAGGVFAVVSGVLFIMAGLRCMKLDFRKFLRNRKVYTGDMPAVKNVIS